MYHQQIIISKYYIWTLDLGARNRKEEALMTRQLHRIVQQSKDCGEKDTEQCVSTFGIFWTRMVTSEVAGICLRLNFQECLNPKSLHITPAVSYSKVLIIRTGTYASSSVHTMYGQNCPMFGTYNRSFRVDALGFSWQKGLIFLGQYHIKTATVRRHCCRFSPFTY